MTEIDTSDRSYGRYLIAAAVVVLALALVAVAAYTYFAKTPDGYVNSQGKQETIFGEPLNRTAIEYEVHQYVNEKRRQAGLEPLSFDPELQGIARDHSRDMVVRGYFRHVSPDGDTVADRYREAGYDCAVRTDDELVPSEENIFLTYAGKVRTERRGTIDYEHNETKIARGVVDWWLNSSGHRQIMLRSYWQREGIGVVINSEDETGTRVMVTQNFC